ncbi:radical SAM protein [Archaeoglobus veneficus]|uniref:radical SAM protein n=1 Tax=Archaeoglobus veneficus TaxID=58290 RepID=UPI000694CBEE|nr:radical SAM protein [Archaeoglobus veneficus]
MGHLIEKWLGNPISKTILKFCASRCSCGRRIELALRKYAGEEVKFCWRCNIAYRLVKAILDSILSKLDIEKDIVMHNLKDPMWRRGLSSVLEGIAKYGPQKPFTAYAPFLIVWNFTNACNLRCKHCYQNASKPTPDELTTAEALKAVDKMGDAGVAYVAMSGGEPLVRKDFFEVADRIRDNDMAFSLATNGTLLTRENVRKLVDLNCLFIQISLDGANPETHDSFRGRKSFERTIQGIKNAVESGITVGIATTVTKHNLKEVFEIVDLAERLGAKIFMHYNFIPTGRGKEIIDLDLSPDEREICLQKWRLRP